MRLFICFLISAVLHSTVAAQQKHALIVAVGTYMPGSNISSIASVNDIRYIKAALRSHGFPENKIDTLVNEKATKAAILAALDNLVTKLDKGDVVVVHFSMHGQQIRDQKEEGRDEDDGYDEALIPYDVKKPQYYPGVYHGENHLRDDDLSPKLAAIRNKLGANGSLLVLIDACHSGTATRSQEFAVSRGEPIPFMDPENPMGSAVNVPSKDLFADAINKEASNMVVISGSGPHQQNFQTLVTVSGRQEQVGSLSYGFYKAMNELDKESSYEDLFRKIKAYIQAHHPTQIPMMEGNSGQVVFSGKYQPKNDLVQVYRPDAQAADTIFMIDKGMMDGLGEGSVLTLFETGSKQAYAKAVIHKADHFQAIGISSLPLKNETSYEARVSQYNYGPLTAAIHIRSAQYSAKNERSIRTAISKLPFISINEKAEMMIRLDSFSNGMQNIHLVDITGNTRWSKEIKTGELLQPEDINDLLTAIKNIVKVKYLRSLPDGGELAGSVQAEIIPANPVGVSDEVILQKGEDFSLRIMNNSGEKLFYTVLDITPDNQVSVLYPTKTRQPADYSIEKFSEVTRKLGVSNDTPPGKEFLKIIVSREPLDLRSVFEHKTQRADMNSFQAVLDDLFGTSQSTRYISSINTDEIGMITTGFIIRPGK